MTTHVVKDKFLGGIKRVYKEVDRFPGLRDYVYIPKSDRYGIIMDFNRISASISAEDVDNDCIVFSANLGSYKILDPTEEIVIKGNTLKISNLIKDIE